jgi:cytochrome oxidase Cu insertion factor (SCO1/SenC/PrrC family)
MNEARRKSKYAPLWILIAVTFLPVLVAWLYYLFYDQLPHIGTSNNGQLVSPVRPVASFDLVSLDGQSYRAGALQGKWTLLTVGSSACAEQCQKNMYIMRQVRLATDRDRSRIQRLFILDDRRQLDQFLARLAGYEGMAVATGDRRALDDFYAILDTGDGLVMDRIFIIDPLGNYMMEYPVGMDPELILEDLKRLLEVSKIG